MVLGSVAARKGALALDIAAEVSCRRIAYCVSAGALWW